ncbi:multiprotein-bridging factor 1 family protein [Streptomyces sp. NPDC091281]|uniref:helix-turn-helix domain-containing protein n=1 Tax=Streptomyces sp. NPDC091281 TaxID=3365985 RepID=UPI00380600B6
MAPQSTEAARQRLALLVKKRRTLLGLSKKGAADAAGMQVNTYSRVEDGLSVDPKTYAKIEPVLGWTAGTCLDVIEGTTDQPSLTGDSGPALISPVHTEDLAADVAVAVQNAAVAVSDGLTAAEIRALKQRAVSEVLKLWEKRGIDRN